ncbi:MAG: hypothetical protein ACXV8S_09655, partial [Methylobacter sp.]
LDLFGAVNVKEKQLDKLTLSERDICTKFITPARTPSPRGTMVTGPLRISARNTPSGSTRSSQKPSTSWSSVAISAARRPKRAD